MTTASNLQAPPRADVIRSLKNGIVLNLLGMGASVLGMQATVGLLVAKALTSSANPYYQGLSPGYSPVLALDVFLVQVFIYLTLVLLHYNKKPEIVYIFIAVMSISMLQTLRYSCL